MNNFDKAFVLAFYNSFFLKKKSNCNKESVLNLNTCSFQKMLSNLTCVLIYLLIQCVLDDGFIDSCVLKIL